MKIQCVQPIPDLQGFLLEQAGYELGNESLDKGYIANGQIAEITEAQADLLDDTGVELYSMCLQAVDKVIKDRRFAEFGIKPDQAKLITNTWNRPLLPDGTSRDPELCARFDLCWDGNKNIKFLEINGDTPTTTYECSVVQYTILQKLMANGSVPANMSQFNSLEEKLIPRLRHIFDMASQNVSDTLHFTSVTEWAEDLGTTTYLEELAQEAGWKTHFTEISQIGANEHKMSPYHGTLYDENDTPIKALYKLMPWEHLFETRYAPYIAKDKVLMLEPAWRAIMSNKMLAVVLWEMFPNHPNLLPSYTTPEPLGDTYVEKPIFGREGSGIKIIFENQVIAGHDEQLNHDAVNYGTLYPKIYQEYCPLPKLPNGPEHGIVTGLWVVGEEVAGMDLRYDNSPITGRDCSRFLPHYMVPHI